MQSRTPAIQCPAAEQLNTAANALGAGLKSICAGIGESVVGRRNDLLPAPAAPASSAPSGEIQIDAKPAPIEQLQLTQHHQVLIPIPFGASHETLFQQ